MKTSKILITALAAAAVYTALPATAQDTAQSSSLRCVDVKDVRDTISRDGGKTLTFTMRNGTTIVNHLRTQCNSLQFGGFIWATAPNGEVCENVQTLHAITTGEICRLGKFDVPVKTASAR